MEQASRSNTPEPPQRGEARTPSEYRRVPKLPERVSFNGFDQQVPNVSLQTFNHIVDSWKRGVMEDAGALTVSENAMAAQLLLRLGVRAAEHVRGCTVLREGVPVSLYEQGTVSEIMSELNAYYGTTTERDREEFGQLGEDAVWSRSGESRRC